MALYPDVELHVESTNRRIDVLGEGFDLAIRVRPPPLPETDLVMRRFDERTIRIVANPQLLRAPAISLPSDLSALPSLTLAPPRRDHRCRLVHTTATTPDLPHTPPPI